MKIRQITQSELPTLLALYQHLHATDAPLPAPEQLEMIWDELLQNPRCRYLGAYLEDTLIASCTIMIIPNLTRGCRPYGLIENVVTDENHRGKGYGKAVVGAALSHAWSAHCYKVMLMTSRQDEGTALFYESAGFDRHEKKAFVIKPPALQNKD